MIMDANSTWLRSLPLLLMSSLLLLGAAWAFFQGNDGTASIAAFAAGLVLLGSWLATAVIDWHQGKSQQLNPERLMERSGYSDDH